MRAPGTSRRASDAHKPTDKPNRSELRAPIFFRLWVFVYEFIVHEFFPLSLPLLVLFEGVNGLFRRELVGSITLMAVVGWFFGIVTKCILVLYFITPGSQVLFIDMLMAVGFSMFRNALIAAKIAFRSPFLARMYREARLTRQHRRREEVLFGMLPSDADLELDDLFESAHRLEIDDPTRPIVVRAQMTPEGMAWAMPVCEVLGRDGGAWDVGMLSDDETDDEADQPSPARAPSVTGAADVTPPARAPFAGCHPERDWAEPQQEGKRSSLHAPSRFSSASTRSKDGAARPSVRFASEAGVVEEEAEGEGDEAIARTGSSDEIGDGADDGTEGGTTVRHAEPSRNSSEVVAPLTPSTLGPRRVGSWTAHRGRVVPAPAGLGGDPEAPASSRDAAEAEVLQHTIPFVAPIMDRLRCGKPVEPLAHLPLGLAGQDEDYGKPPVRSGTYATVSMAALALHMRLCDVFETQRLVVPADRRWFLSNNASTVVRATFAVVVVALAPLGRFVDAAPPFPAASAPMSALYWLCALTTFAICFGFLASFVSALMIHALRLLWVMQRLTALIDSPTACDAEVCDDWLPLHPSDLRSRVRRRVSTGSGPLFSLGQSIRRIPARSGRMLQSGLHGVLAGAGTDEERAARSGEVVELVSDDGVPLVHRFPRAFTMDLRFTGNANAFLELRRWVASAHARMLQRVQWVYVFLFLFIATVAARVLVDALQDVDTPMAFLLPALFVSGVAFITLITYLGLATRHNEMLVTHAHLVRKQQLTIERDYQAAMDGRRARRAMMWTLDPGSRAARVVRRLTPRWAVVRDSLRTLANLFDAEVHDIHVGPKLKLGGLAVSRTVLRIVISTTASAVLFILQQVLFRSSAASA